MMQPGALITDRERAGLEAITTLKLRSRITVVYFAGVPDRALVRKIDRLLDGDGKPYVVIWYTVTRDVNPRPAGTVDAAQRGITWECGWTEDVAAALRAANALGAP